jgi:hypothetical protein
MSEPFFDQIARTLATPMPRRRALRLVGSTLAAAALGGIWTRTARAYEFCGGNTLDPYQPGIDGCCVTQDASKPFNSQACEGVPNPVCCYDATGFAVCCPPDTLCAPDGSCMCPPGHTQCQNSAGTRGCCPPGQACVFVNGDLSCECPQDKKCGSSCCGQNEVCITSTNTCCPTGRACAGGICCAPNEICNPETGQCVCDPARRCGSTCCPPGQVCDKCTTTCVPCVQCSPPAPCATSTETDNSYRGTFACYLQYKNTTGIRCSNGVFEHAEGCTVIDFFRVGFTVGAISKPSKDDHKQWCVSAPVNATYYFDKQTNFLDWVPDPSPCCSAGCTSEISRWRSELDRHEEAHVADAEAIRVAANNKWINNDVTFCGPKHKDATEAALRAEAERQTSNYTFTMYDQLDRCGEALDNCQPIPPDLVGVCGPVFCAPITNPDEQKCAPGGQGKTCCGNGTCADHCCP